MSLFNYLLISILFLSTAFDFRTFSEGQDCENLDISHTVTKPEIGQFKLSISPNGGIAPYRTALSDETGELVSEDFSKTEFQLLKKGTYTCIVVDSKKCVRQKEIVLE